MTIATCPNCQSRIELSIPGAPKKPTRPDPADRSHTDPKTQRLVQQFLRTVPADEYYYADIEAMYESWRPQVGAPALSRPTLGRCLKLAGAKPWRTASHRGYTVPEEIAKPEPATPAPRFDPDDLPFQIG